MNSSIVSIFVIIACLLPTTVTGVGKNITCKNKFARTINCPARVSNSAKAKIDGHIDSCINRKAAAQHDASFTCFFFPLVKNESCHLQDQKVQPQVQCTHGFIIRGTRQRRRGGNTGVFIYVRFFGLIQPSPINETMTKGTKFDTTEWLAFGASPKDTLMGNDLVLYCHPMMDKKYFKGLLNATANSKEEVSKWYTESYYPDTVGLAVNSYGNQAYASFRATKTNEQQRGRIENLEVSYMPGGDGEEWGLLDCSAEVTTYMLLQAKTRTSIGMELDMEKDSTAYIFIAVGACLQQYCYGANETAPTDFDFREQAIRTTVMAKHRKVFTTPRMIVLFDRAERTNGADVFRADPGIFIILISLAFLF